MKFAAIDIGSNAGRLLIGNIRLVDGVPKVKKISLTRVPLRLGEEVFSTNEIPEEKIKMLTKTIKAYRHLMDVYEVEAYRACATSAIREAKNGKEVVKLVQKTTGIDIEIIAGKEEADLILSTFFTQNLDTDKSYLYIDVGGGSTEISLLEAGEKIASRSFEIGTLRVLKGKVTKNDWDEMKSWLKKLDKGDEPLTAIGTGGNINRLLKLNKINKEDNFIRYAEIKAVANYVQAFSLKERMEILGMRSDRADVIIPASDIYLAAMRYGGAEEMIVPKIGLSDGIIYSLYKKHCKKN